jgi:integrase
MSSRHPTAPAPSGKPAKPDKPYPEFPLTAHPAGYWCKKIRGTIHYFGPWADPDGALAKYLAQKEALHAGRKPREATEDGTVKDLANRFLNAKKALVEAGELSPRTWDEYKATCVLIVSHFGKGRLLADVDTADFASLRNKMAKQWGPVRLGNCVQRVRTLFKYGYDSGMLDRPMRFGPDFKKPSKKTLRKARNDRGPRMFEADELRKLIGAAGPAMRAMIYLAINAGFGNADCGTLTLKALDVERGWVDYPRPKTGVRRRAPLWPETVQAIREALAKRPEPKNPADAGLVFVTKYGGRWHKDTPDNPVSKEMAKLLDEVGIRRRGLNFYAIRHTFETIGGESRDQPAVDLIMGHAEDSDDMAAVYRERISDERLKAVTDHVRVWLFAASKPEADGAGQSEDE